jgi:hypothetical protein
MAIPKEMLKQTCPHCNRCFIAPDPGDKSEINTWLAYYIRHRTHYCPVPYKAEDKYESE